MSAVKPAMASCAPYRVTVSIFEKPGVISRRSDPFRFDERYDVRLRDRDPARVDGNGDNRAREAVDDPLAAAVHPEEARVGHGSALGERPGGGDEQVTVAGEAAGLRPVVVAVVVALELGERHRLGASGDRGQHLLVV